MQQRQDLELLGRIAKIREVITDKPINYNNAKQTVTKRREGISRNG